MHQMTRRVKLLKQIPNLLTMLRIVCAVLLLFFRPLSAWFFTLYLFAGLSDLLDGYLARRLGVSSELGARLDSAADFLLCAVLLAILIPLYVWPVWVIVWIAAIALIRLFAIAVCYLRFRKLAFLHTYANKATGLFLFLSPVLFWLFGLTVTTILLCILATISAFEELLIELQSKSLNPDCRSILPQSYIEKCPLISRLAQRDFDRL